MKILVVSQHYYPENFRITNICETLVSMGHKVSVVCGYPNYPEGEIYDGYKGKDKKKHKNEIINGVNVMRCFEISRGHSTLRRFLNYYSVCLSMKRKAKKIKEKYDCVFVNETSPIMVGWAGVAYAKKNKVPCILYCYDLWPASLTAGGVKTTSLIYKYFNKVSRDVYSRVDRICVTSRSFANYLVTIHNIDKTKISYLPQYCEDVFSNIKDNLKNDYNFVFAGNIGKIQSVETIVKAANLLKDRKDIKIHIVGDGSDADGCKKLASDLCLDNVIFYGKRPIDEMPDFYSLADAMIVTLGKDDLISKTLPGKVQSYMAASKPIIGAIDGETKAIIEESGCGLVCDAEDFTQLATYFREFDKEKAKKFSLNSRKFYENNFEKNVFFNSLERELMGE